MSFPGSSYYFRYRIDDGHIWESVGDDPFLADINLRRKNLKLPELALGNSPTLDLSPTALPRTLRFRVESCSQHEQAKSSLLLNDAIREYLYETKNHKSGKTYVACRERSCTSTS